MTQLQVGECRSRLIDTLYHDTHYTSTLADYYRACGAATQLPLCLCLPVHRLYFSDIRLSSTIVLQIRVALLLANTLTSFL